MVSQQKLEILVNTLISTISLLIDTLVQHRGMMGKLHDELVVLWLLVEEI